jgi:hypothetical protein
MDELSTVEFRTAAHRGPWVSIAQPVFDDWACYAPGQLPPGTYRGVMNGRTPVDLKVVGATPDDWALRLVARP